MTSTITLSFLTNLLIGFSLNLLWGMLENQQIVVHSALNNIEYPGNVAFFYSYLLNIAAFDVFPTDDIFDWFFIFKPSEPVTARFGALGYETKYFVKNMGTAFIIGVVFAILLILTLFLYVLNKIVNISVTEKVANWVYRMVCWNPILRFLIESYIFFAISCFINLTEFTFGDSGSRASSISTVVGMIIIIVLPFLVLCFMLLKFAKLKNKQVIAKYGAMYEGLDLDKGRTVILARLFFFFRRLIIGLSVNYLRDYPVFQIFSMNFQVVAAIILHGQINPHPTR